eukprot:344918-Pleurochrysis_carterae.AAC.2
MSPPTTVSTTTTVPSIANPPPAASTPTPPEMAASQRTPATDAAERDVERQPSDKHSFKRTLGPYPLRSRGAALLALRSRRDKPQWGRNTGCAFAACAASADPRTRKQAMAEDRIGW